MEVLESLLLTVVGCLHRDTEAIVLGTAHFSANDRDKFTKINSAIAIFVEFADKLVEFGIIKVDMIVREGIAQLILSHCMIAREVEPRESCSIMLEVRDKFRYKHGACLFGSALGRRFRHFA
mmetsp:Transcript_26920/g.91655  ORF Transcript_26920/g.91655 Transcript_26920/m.91655 type:complete len:122 (+) Transcript_26920:888-1253(+)